LDPVEFAPLNFDFHPRAVRSWLQDAGFRTEKKLAVSHFRVDILKRTIPARILAGLDSLFQWTGALWQLTPSVFIKARAEGGRKFSIPADPLAFFKCPDCGHAPLVDQSEHLLCSACNHSWEILNGIYDFRGSGS
jgi:pimeloyl-ACP methyl ester carboxylesterase